MKDLALKFDNFVAVAKYNYHYLELRNLAKQYSDISYAAEPSEEFWQKHKNKLEAGKPIVSEILFVPLRKTRNFRISGEDFKILAEWIAEIPPGPLMTFKEYVEEF